MRKTREIEIDQVQVKKIDTLDQFERIRSNWERIYAADPNTNLFTSWLWVYEWLKSMPYQNFVLAVKTEDRPGYISFLPLHYRGTGKPGFQPIRNLFMGGHPYTGYVGIYVYLNTSRWHSPGWPHT